MGVGGGGRWGLGAGWRVGRLVERVEEGTLYVLVGSRHEASRATALKCGRCKVRNFNGVERKATGAGCFSFSPDRRVSRMALLSVF